jgi:N6-L-threonylcarbamoyladenine synthase
MTRYLLAIETSCDETAAAVISEAYEVRSSVVASQIDLHAEFGGVVPEIASRAHVELITPIISQALGSSARCWSASPLPSRSPWPGTSRSSA